ncbi:MAG: polyphosphate kinase 2 family protein [Betaproteobacteria bacterium]|jgi:PPK2 family polyphosphate:nucleotide phosphotransferase|nr:polyphosphate kinase 2 family protein [Betaproteobacteria bacterium]MBK7080846.1 polyphosphate kinase 2 family protein [Betaproteobacteria bacterium]MBK9676391.1 polyphosphate kinase 2 family protein [Betaproteobacteria bacterium]
MLSKKAVAATRRFVEPYRVVKGKRFRLADFDPDDTGGLGSESKPRARDLLAHGVEWLAEAQDKLYAQNRWSVLLVFQAMDAAGKDGTIKHVTSGLNPQGCQVYSFKQPSAEELDHDFLWRATRCLPERGRIGIFNRSHYEEVLVVRVHQEILRGQQLPAKLVGRRIWDERLEDIAAYERHLARNGTVILKFFLNVSRKEQKRRFLERLDEPEKNWKFAAADVTERGHWDAYMAAYEAAIRATAARHAPWYVVPADNKWYTRLVVAAAIVDAMESLDLAYPTIDEAQRRELAAARATLAAEG